MRKLLWIVSAALLASLVSCTAAEEKPPPIPHLKKKGDATQLIVDGEPYLILGGELHNSSASSAEYMDDVWPRLRKMNLNTVLAVVSWDQFEPVEGKYDYSLTDDLIISARLNDVRLIILWFGSWKNGISGYIPEWVKRDQQRFPRVKNKNGHTLEILSPLSPESRDADAKAFAALMKHIKEEDSERRTVIMVQVQNEVGMHSDSRDRSELAEKAFSQPVPKELLEHLKKNKDRLLPELTAVWERAGFKNDGTWEEVFGEGPATDEIFMAWQYASYINKVTAAGKQEYDLPMFVNAWLVQPQDKTPGDYPSGGPVAHVLDIWRAGASQIDFFAPDIYLPDFTGAVERFTRSGNPLFIPESRAGKVGAGNAMLAIANYNAMGYSPFGIDGERMDGDYSFMKTYALLASLTPLILQYQGTDSIAAVALNADEPSRTIRMGNYDLLFSILQNRRTGEYLDDIGYGMAVKVGQNEFVVSGNSLQVAFRPNDSDSVAGFLAVEEGVFKNGEWKPGRRLNGDEVQLRYDLGAAAFERLSGEGLKLRPEKYVVQKVSLYNYK